MPDKVYLDANGNAAGAAPPVYLDPNTGEPITGHPDTRNFLQKGADYLQKKADELTTVTPEQEAGHSWLTNKAQEFGAGAIQGATAPIVHPLNTLEGIGNTILHPINTGKAVLQSALANPAQTAGNVVGGAVLGEGAGPVARAVGNVAGKPVSRALLLGKTPEGAYESALKPSTTLSDADRAAMVKTGLENSIPVSRGGLETLSNRIDDLNNAIKGEIAKDPNRPISTVPAIRNLKSVRDQFSNQVTPQPDLAEIQQVQNNFLTNPKIAPQGAGPGPSSLPASEAQAMKTGTYRALGDKAYGELKGANIEAQKSLARGLKDEIATQFPEIGNLNAAESKLLDLQPALERAVARKGNHQLFGIGTPISAAATEALTGSGKLAAVAGVLKAVLDDPFVKSRLAIAISKGGNIPFAQAAAKVGAYSGALQSTASGAQATQDDQTGSK
jgi:hypothetical protein